MPPLSWDIGMEVLEDMYGRRWWDPVCNPIPDKVAKNGLNCGKKVCKCCVRIDSKTCASLHRYQQGEAGRPEASLFIYLFIFTPDVTEFRIDIIHILINLPITPKKWT